MTSFSGLDRDRVEHSARRMSQIHKKRRKYLTLLRCLGLGRQKQHWKRKEA